jgi:hypothetical protein
MTENQMSENCHVERTRGQLAHQANSLYKRCRKCTEDVDYRIQPGHQFRILLAKLAENLGLRSEYVRDRLGAGAIAGIELGGKRMGIETCSCRRFVIG